MNDEDAYPQSNAIVKNVREGYLFARSGDTDVFVHSTDFADGKFAECRQGDSLSLEIVSSPKGPRGRNAKRTEQPAGALA